MGFKVKQVDWRKVYACVVGCDMSVALYNWKWVDRIVDVVRNWKLVSTWWNFVFDERIFLVEEFRR